MACFLLLERRGCFERLLSLLRDQLPHSSFPRPYGTCNLEDRVFFTRKHWFRGAITPFGTERLNSNKGTKCEIGIYPRPFRPWGSALFATPKNVSLWSANFGGLIPTVSWSFSSEGGFCGDMQKPPYSVLMV